MSAMITAKQAATMLALSKPQIYTLAREGELPCVQMGGSRRFFVADVEAYVRKHYTGDDLAGVNLEPAAA